VHFVRVVNAAFMIAAVGLIFAAFARAVSPLAGLLGGFYLALHPAFPTVMWSIGPDPLLWLFVTAALALWVRYGATSRGAIAVAIAGGLAASAKLDGALVVAGYCLWLLARRQPRRAVLSGAIALALFVLVNPILFSRGVLGVPGMLWNMFYWRGTRTAMMTLNYPAYAAAPRWYIPFYLMGSWWTLVPLLLVSPRLWRLEPAVFWAVVFAVGHIALVTVPEPRYTLYIDAGVALGLIAGYWPGGLLQRLAWWTDRPNRPTAGEDVS
jgi:hypothetical protein